MRLTKTVFGLIATFLYIGAIFVIRYPFNLETLRSMPINTLGDALTGIVGPLALMWLVLGYFQQGEELRQNGKALEMQAEELKNAVEQHAAMATATQEQVTLMKQDLTHRLTAAMMANRPAFGLEKCSYIGNSEGRTAVLRFKLVKGVALGVLVQIPNFDILECNTAARMEAKDTFSLKFRDAPEETTAMVAIHFRDETAANHRQDFFILRGEDGYWEHGKTAFAEDEKEP